MKCPVQSKLHYIDRAPSEQSGAASYGTIIHYVVEQIDRGMSYEDAEKLFRTLWQEPERLGVKPDYFPMRTSYDSYLRKGVATIAGYREMRSWGKPKIIAHEYKFLVPIGDHEIRGVIDRLDIRKTGKGYTNDCLAVIDFKSAARRPTKWDLRTDLQFTIYRYAMTQEQFWTGVPGSSEYLGFADGQELYEWSQSVQHRGVYLMLGESCTELDTGERTEMDYKQLYRLITEVQSAIDNEVFIPRIGADTCGYCDYFDLCGIDIPKPSLDLSGEPVRIV